MKIPVARIPVFSEVSFVPIFDWNKKSKKKKCCKKYKKEKRCKDCPDR